MERSAGLEIRHMWRQHYHGGLGSVKGRLASKLVGKSKCAEASGLSGHEVGWSILRGPVCSFLLMCAGLGGGLGYRRGGHHQRSSESTVQVPHLLSRPQRCPEKCPKCKEPPRLSNANALPRKT